MFDSAFKELSNYKHWHHIMTVSTRGIYIV